MPDDLGFLDAVVEARLRRRAALRRLMEKCDEVEARIGRGAKMQPCPQSKCYPERQGHQCKCAGCPYNPPPALKVRWTL